MLGIKLFLFFMFVLIIALLCGEALNILSKKSEISILHNILQGVIVLLAIFEIECVIGVYLKISLSALTIIYTCSIGAICMIALILMIKEKKLFKISFSCRVEKEILPLVLSVLLIIGLQTFVGTCCMYENADDASYSAITMTALETDTLLEYSQYTGGYRDDFWDVFRRALSPFNLFVAVIVKLIDVHPAIIYHTICPLFLIPMAYVIYWKLSGKLFEIPKERWVFMLFCSLLNLSGGYSVYTPSTFLLTRIWQGKAIYAAIFIPWMIYCLITLYQNKIRRNWILLFLSSVGGILLSNIAVIGNIILIVVYAFLDCLKNKKVKDVIYSIICCTPMLICGVIMLLSMFMTGGL